MAHPEALTLIASRGGAIEDVKGVYDYFTTRLIDPGHHPVHLRRAPRRACSDCTMAVMAGRMVALY